jgi:hypothetical protein
MRSLRELYRAYDKAWVENRDKGYYMKKKMTYDEYVDLYKEMELEQQVALAESGKKKYDRGIAYTIKKNETRVYKREHMELVIDTFKESFEKLTEENKRKILSKYPEAARVFKESKGDLIDAMQREHYKEHGLRWQLFEIQKDDEYGSLITWVISPKEEDEEE